MYIWTSVTSGTSVPSGIYEVAIGWFPQFPNLIIVIIIVGEPQQFFYGIFWHHFVWHFSMHVFVISHIPAHDANSLKSFLHIFKRRTPKAPKKCTFLQMRPRDELLLGIFYQGKFHGLSKNQVPILLMDIDPSGSRGWYSGVFWGIKKFDTFTHCTASPPSQKEDLIQTHRFKGVVSQILSLSLKWGKLKKTF